MKTFVLSKEVSRQEAGKLAYQCVLARDLAALTLNVLTLKAPVTTAADDKFCNIFPNFRKK